MLGTEGTLTPGAVGPYPGRPMNWYHLGHVWLLVWALAAVAVMRGCP